MSALANVALPILRNLRATENEWREERERQRRLPVRDRDFDWQSYCRHGRNIGDPYGADLMCEACESGLSDYELALEIARGRLHVYDQTQIHLKALHNLRAIDQDTAMRLSREALDRLMERSH